MVPEMMVRKMLPDQLVWRGSRLKKPARGLDSQSRVDRCVSIGRGRDRNSFIAGRVVGARVLVVVAPQVVVATVNPCRRRRRYRASVGIMPPAARLHGRGIDGDGALGTFFGHVCFSCCAAVGSGVVDWLEEREKFRSSFLGARVEGWNLKEDIYPLVVTYTVYAFVGEGTIIYADWVFPLGSRGDNYYCFWEMGFWAREEFSLRLVNVVGRCKETEAKLVEKKLEKVFNVPFLQLMCRLNLKEIK